MDNAKKQSFIGRVMASRPVVFCIAVFAICLTGRIIEYVILRTDSTILGENVLHKLFGIALLAIILAVCHRKWSSIGFRASHFWRNIGIGLALGAGCYACAFATELSVLNAAGTPGQIEFYVSSFSLTGESIKQTAAGFIALCIVLNIANVVMEEGIFRGLFITQIGTKHSFAFANTIAALLFGLWHVVMPLRGFADGDLSAIQAFALCLGYIVLAGLMSVKWGLLYRMSGTLWIGIADHLFNNAIATNLLHVATAIGNDEWQILRIVVAQTLSLAIVAIVYARKKKANSLAF